MARPRPGWKIRKLKVDYRTRKIGFAKVTEQFLADHSEPVLCPFPNLISLFCNPGLLLCKLIAADLTHLFCNPGLVPFPCSVTHFYFSQYPLKSPAFQGFPGNRAKTEVTAQSRVTEQRNEVWERAQNRSLSSKL